MRNEASGQRSWRTGMAVDAGGLGLRGRSWRAASRRVPAPARRLRRHRGRRSRRPGDSRRTTPAVGRVRIAVRVDDRARRSRPAAPPVPTAAALPAGPAGAAASPRASATGATPAPPPRLPVDTTLIPGRVVEPIDLANALKLAGAHRAGYRDRPAAASSRPRPT